MNLWVYEFRYMNSYDSEFDNIFMNAWIRIYKFIVPNLYSWIWLHNVNIYYETITENKKKSIFWVHGIEFNNEIWHMILFLGIHNLQF